MPGRLPKTLLACALAAVLAGCGSGDDGTIPRDEGENLVSILNSIESSIESRDCDLVAAQAQEFANGVNSLPQDVDPEVQKGLTQAAARLVDLSDDPDQCSDTSSTSPPAESETPTTSTSVEESTTTSTTSTTSTTTEPEEDNEEQPPPEQDDNGQGNEDNGPPVEVPGGGGGEGSGGRGATESGGLEGGKR